MLGFRDYLRAHPEVAGAYGRLKVQLAAEHRLDREAYTEGKSAMVAELSAAARQWTAGQ